ncbi:MAG TPA: M23 family metallopeptidase [Chloroflexi bacterium]|nr:M23 family metallopeptidase [Chloroflexota bacterium]
MGKVVFPVAADGRVQRVFGFVDWERYAQSGGVHTGVDLAAQGGKAVYAVADGQVISVARGEVAVEHEGWVSVYRHVTAIRVHPGDAVKAGDLIAAVGRRGYLHYEVRLNGETRPDAAGLQAIWAGEAWAVDPLRWLAMQLPQAVYCGGVVAHPGVRVYADHNLQSQQVGFLPQGAPVEGMEMWWDVHGTIWMRLRALPAMWLITQEGLMRVKVKQCNG